MNVVISYYIAGLSLLSLLMIWFISTYKVLSRKRDAVYKAAEELQLHRDGYQGVLSRPEESTARRILDTSVQIHDQIKLVYNSALKSPIYRFTGFLMGFRSIL
jgi:hypothetical protein